jgi:tetratricopeptide (TPR) repeat protein
MHLLMRRLLRSTLLVVTTVGLTSVALPARQSTQNPPGSVVAQADARSKDEALNTYGPALADRSKAIMGTLNVTDARFYRRWDLVVQAWKKEKNTSPDALIAEGVLFDCLSRLHGILTGVLGSEAAVPYFLDLAAQRPKRASKAFQAALKRDPHLTEARFRDARIRADKDADARAQLEQLSTEPGPMGYLATMSRAETARARDDDDGARRWYERAIARLPGAPAPHFGLAGLTPGSAVPFDTLQPTDPYYTYPCTVLTESASVELSRRMRTPVAK